MLLLEGLSIYYKIKILIQNLDAYSHNWKISSKRYSSYGEGWPDPCYDKLNQSPIDIDTSSAEPKDYPPFEFTNYDVPQEGFIENSGYSVEIKLEQIPLTISGSCLSCEYILHNIHFHWNSEHTINGHRFPLEAHFVHYLKAAGTIGNAVQLARGIAVLSVFYDFQLTMDENLAFEELANHVEFVATKIREPILFDAKFVPKTLLPKFMDEYYTYHGSLTVPNCQESVVWIVFPRPAKITLDQFAALKDIYDNDSKPVVRNARPTQLLNGRTITYTCQQNKRDIQSQKD